MLCISAKLEKNDMATPFCVLKIHGKSVVIRNVGPGTPGYHLAFVFYQLWLHAYTPEASGSSNRNRVKAVPGAIHLITGSYTV